MSEDIFRPDPQFLESVKKKLASLRSKPGPGEANETITLESVGASQGKAEASRQKSSAYEQAAAVLAWYDPATIKPLIPTPDRSQLDHLLSRSALVADAEGKRRWTLLPEPRIEALRELRQSGRIDIALSANAPPSDPTQQALDTYLSGNAKPLEAQSLRELTATFDVCGWLRAAGFDGLPPSDAIGSRSDWLALLQPFEHLAGDDQFRGRVEELRRLRSYAGVLPPGSVLESARRSLELFFNLSEKPPLSIFGQGGVGKSTLLARFILEHARAHASDRFPFVYLDCDRPDVDAGEPLTLLIEAIRQLGIEYPEAREACEKLRDLWTQALATGRAQVETQSASVRSGTRTSIALESAIRDFANVVVNIGARDLPVLFVLDTFEEVQWRSAADVAAVWKLLEDLQKVLPRLRVIIAGRAPIEGRITEAMALTGLDEEAAVAYLQARGINDETTARRVARQIGGSPLSLKLAVELAQREGLDSSGQLAVATRQYFFLRLDSALLQRQLYKRILSHVHDEKVRKLAHPGLVLRRITPDLIWKVLAQPCGIEVTSEDQAEELFRQLKREVALVTSEPDGSLRQRQELRILMLDLLRSDNPEKVRRIHEAAVSYYQPRPLLAAERAEEIYHRLQLDQEPGVIDARWVDGLERYLASAFEEFSGRRLAYLATRLGVDVDDETRQLADLEDWEKITARDVQALFAQNQTAQALQLMRVRTERSTVSPLIALEARALALQANWNDALSVLDSGFQRAASEGERSRALALALQAAEVVLSARLEAEARAAFERLTGANADTLSNVQQFEATVRQLALIRLDRELTAESSGLNERFRTLFDSFPDDVLGQNPGLCYWAATVFETTDAARLARVIVLCGLPQGHELETRQIASELTSFDAALSRDFGETPGILAREAGIPLQSSLTATWSEFLLKGDSSKVRDALSGLLLKHASFTPGRLIEAFAQLMLVSLGVRRQVVARPAEAKATSALNKPTMKRLQDALISAFEPNEFAAFLRIRLDRNVEAISTLQQPFNFIVSRVIEVANAEGWVFELITQASYAKPRNQNIAAVAADVGLASSPSEPALERIVRNSAFHDVHAFSSRLSQISAAICRVEVGDVLGTGFLVGVDLLLTADFVMSKLLEKAVPLSAVNFRFDYKGDNENRLTRGTLFGLAEDWLVARDPYRSADDGLGYVLLRLAGSPGAQPIGSERAESSEQLRQWLSVPDPSSLPHHGEQLLIAGHPAGRPLQISFGQAAAASPDARLRYTVDTAAGSSGAPCFTGSLELAGMHLGKEPYTGANFNFGVSMMAIVADLDRKGLGQLLRTQFL